MQDIRNALRSLSRAPAFTVMTGLILVIGMGGATAMVAVIYGVLLRPLPVHQQDRIVVAWKELRSSGYAHYPFGHDYLDVVANESRLFDRVAGVSKHAVSRVSIVDAGVTTDVNEAEVTGAFFEVLGVQAVIGRTFVRADDVDGAEDVVVVSHGLWQRRYSGATDIVGRRLSIGGRRFAIVGVIPRDLDYPTGADIWRLTRSFDGPFRDAVRSEVDLIGRLKPGVTIDQAASELSALTRRQEENGIRRRAAWFVSGGSILRAGGCRRRAADIDGAVRGGGARPSHRERKCGQPVSDAQRGETSGIRRAPGARRTPHPYRRAGDGGNRASHRCRRRRWTDADVGIAPRTHHRRSLRNTARRVHPRGRGSRAVYLRDCADNRGGDGIGAGLFARG